MRAIVLLLTLAATVWAVRRTHAIAEIVNEAAAVVALLGMFVVVLLVIGFVVLPVLGAIS